MKPAPSKRAETVVGWLLPPACREYVLGDLHERYVSPRQYFREAVHTAPLVILSRIRRTTDARVLLMEAFALYLSFVVSAWVLGPPLFLEDQQGLLRLAIPTAATLAALILRDAWALPGKRAPLLPILDAAFAVGLAFLAQAALMAVNPEWAVPRWIMMGGGGASLLLASTLRMLFPPDSSRPRGAT